MKIAEVILPLPLPGTFTYQLPEDIEVNPGARVIVPFGKSKIYTGVVASSRQLAKAPDYQIKEILEILDEEPIIAERQLTFIFWVASYYMSALGDTYNAALPAGLKLTSESFISINEDMEVDTETLSDNEMQVLAAIGKNDITTDDIKKITGLKHPYRLIKKMRDARLIDVYEKVKDRYTPKKETRVRLEPKLLVPAALEKLVNSLEKKPKQQDAIMAYLNQVPILENPILNAEGITKKDLIALGVSSSSLKVLSDKGVFEIWKKNIDRFESTMELDFRLPTLTLAQDGAISLIRSAWQVKPCVLLQGVTGSGKTEIYINLIRESLDKGKQVLLLLPEIALTTQIISRFRRYFGDRFGVYHSRFSDNERAEIYQKCLNRSFDFIIGVRSSVFLPFTDLGLIIVDEEHEHSYKQYDPAPRYHARDAAIYLSHLHQAQVLLGSATPSLESYVNALEGKYGFVTLSERYENQPSAKIELVDMVKARKQRRIKGSFSADLLEAIEQSLAVKKQVILFQNRRGYAPYLQCDDCAEIPKCKNCAVSLTYHIYQNELICHYCGYRRYHDTACTACGSTAIRSVGTGTEKLEEELQLLLPEAKIQRMDLDTTRSKYAYQQIIDDFERGKTQILVGTQMVSKGLDFEHVNLVGVFDIDRIINFPDFRSHERAWQLITQVSGRSGRKHQQGRVLIQTNDPTQKIMGYVREHQLEAFYRQELQERFQYGYPPYLRQIRCVIRHKDKAQAAAAAQAYYQQIHQQITANNLLGPIEPLISKIRNYYIYEITIRLEKKKIDLPKVKQFLMACRDSILVLPANKSVLIHFDVDPI